METQLSVDFNGYLIFILTLMIVGYAIDLVADLLNASRLQPNLPEEFNGIYDPAKYRTSIEYQKESIRFDTIQKTFWLAVTLLFILLGGFNKVDLFSRHFDLGPIATGLIFVGTLSVLRFIVGLPFSIY